MRAAQQGKCADPGFVTDYNTFVLGDHRVTNDSVNGRMAVGGDARVQQMSAGQNLTANAARIDLVVGKSIISGGNAATPRGGTTYGGTLSGQFSAYQNAISNTPPPFNFSDTFTTLRSAQQSWADLAPNGTVTLPEFDYSPINFRGTDADLNVFRVSAANLQSAQQIQIRVPDGATTLINVTGVTYTSGFRPTYSITFWDGSNYVQFSDNPPNDRVGRARERLMWSFPDATAVQLGSTTSGMDWQGSVLGAPGARDARQEHALPRHPHRRDRRADRHRDAAAVRRLPAGAVSAGPDAHADTDRDTHLDADRHAHLDAHGDADGDTFAYAYDHPDPDADGRAAAAAAGPDPPVAARQPEPAERRRPAGDGRPHGARPLQEAEHAPDQAGRQGHLSAADPQRRSADGAAGDGVRPSAAGTADREGQGREDPRGPGVLDDPPSSRARKRST